MTTISKELLSASTNGKPVNVAATETAGTLIHTATNTAGELDEVWAWLTNLDDADVVATVEWGDATSPDHNMEFTVPAHGVILAVPGWLLNGGATMKVFAGTANVINVAGYVHRIGSS